ncbi:hypothetical protein Q8A73_000125 [Channa argus]|nr:hypothetical protein Q8A73_000125 [Channa argus]
MEVEMMEDGDQYDDVDRTFVEDVQRSIWIMLILLNDKHRDLFQSKKRTHSLLYVGLVRVAQLQAETPADGPRAEALPPARKQGDLPPLWWLAVHHFVCKQLV